MGLYASNEGQGPDDLFEARVLSVSVLSREAYRVAGEAEVYVEVPSRGYGPQAWSLSWYPENDMMEFDFSPPEGAPSDDDGNIDDEYHDLGRFLAMVVISGQDAWLSSMQWGDLGRDALERAWGIDTAVRTGF